MIENISTSPPAVRPILDLGFFIIEFQAYQSLTILQASNAHFLQIIINIATLSLSWSSKGPYFPSEIFLTHWHTNVLRKK
jgi:hypothetical protein